MKSWLIILCSFAFLNLFSSCALDELFNANPNDCTGDPDSESYEWFNENYHEKGTNLIGKFNELEDSYEVKFWLYANDVCAGPGINATVNVFLEDASNLNGTTFTVGDFMTSCSYEVYKYDEEGDKLLFSNSYNFLLTKWNNTESYWTTRTFGLLDKAEDFDIVDVAMTVKITYPKKTEDYPTGEDNSFIYLILSSVGITMSFEH